MRGKGGNRKGIPDSDEELRERFMAYKSSEALRARFAAVFVTAIGALLMVLNLMDGIGLAPFYLGNPLGAIVKWMLVLAGFLMILTAPLFIMTQSMIMPVTAKREGLHLPGQSLRELLAGRKVFIPFENVSSISLWMEDRRLPHLGPHIIVEFTDEKGKRRKARIYERQIYDPPDFTERLVAEMEKTSP